MSKAKAIGTAAETAVVKYLQSLGWENVQRVVLHGKDDLGDIHVGNPDHPHTVIEVKSRKNEATYKEVEEFMEELENEAVHTWHRENWRNDELHHAYLIIKRPGKGKVEDWWICWKEVKDGCTLRARVGDFLGPKY